MCRARLKDEFRLSDDVRGPIKDDVNLMIRRCSKVIANRRLPPFIHPGGLLPERGSYPLVGKSCWGWFANVRPRQVLVMAHVFVVFAHGPNFSAKGLNTAVPSQPPTTEIAKMLKGFRTTARGSPARPK